MGPQLDLGPLERTAREAAAEWGLELGHPFTLSRHSYVAPAGDDAVLKVTPSHDDESDQEADALSLWKGDGAVRLLRHSPERRGDFHHHNILDAGGRYVAIDPKAMLGEPEYDVPSFLWNPIQTRMELEVTERRLAAFRAAGLDDARMRAWRVIRAAYLGADPEDVEVLRALL